VGNADKCKKHIFITMKNLILIGIFLILSSQIPNAFAGNQNASRKVDRIETLENGKITYYKDGTTATYLHFTGTTMLTFNLSGTADVDHTSFVPPPQFPADYILKIVKLIFETVSAGGVVSTLLAWMIWNSIKTLRKGRPKDYWGVTW
jgi:hypothetical protein